MIRAGVVGWPAKHSLSPIIHRAWLEAAGIEGEYDIYEREDFQAFLREARDLGLKGVNVTIPFKEQAFVAADLPTETARKAGAANLLIFGNDVIRGRNTDGLGLLDALAQRGFSPRSGPVAVLGAGGAARGAVAALIHNECPEVRIVNRTKVRAEAIKQAIDGPIGVFGWAETAQAFDGVVALINATSLGLAGGEALDVSLAGLPKQAAVMDMVYRPLETNFLKAAKAAGYWTVDGLDMLIGQARPSFQAFFGPWPPEQVDVRALCLAELERRGG